MVDFRLVRKYPVRTLHHHLRSDEALSWLQDWGRANVTFVAMALENEECVGFWQGMENGPAILSKGTWVHRDYRKTGLATQLWVKTLRALDISCVSALSQTDEGEAFLRTIQTEANIEVVGG